MDTVSDSPVVLLTPEQAAEALGIGRWKLDDLQRQGRLRSLRIGSCRRISTEAPRAFVTELEAAGLRRIRFHDLRHTFATLQVANNQPLRIVSEMMGHTRIAITQDL